MLKKKYLSKSQFVRGKQCTLSLWYYNHRKDLIPPIDSKKQSIFDQGHEVGLLAQKLFPNGVLIDAHYSDFDDANLKTQNAIRNGHKAIYEAIAIAPDGTLAKIDILNKREDGEWDLIEVKSSTDIKDEHLIDVSFQRYVFGNAGFKINKSSLVVINNKYVKNGDIEVENLFKIIDVTEKAKDFVDDIKDEVKYFKNIIESNQEPQIKISSHCNKPYECEFKHHCWKNAPKYSVFDIFNSGKKLDELLEKDIFDVLDVPKSFKLTKNQNIELETYKRKTISKDRNQIKIFLEKFKHPLFFLDYETIGPAIPLFDKSSPYSQFPFQYSLHIEEYEGAELKHFQFLHKEIGDPRIDFIHSLIKNCRTNGSVVVYNQNFEEGCNKRLSEDFPEYKKQLMDINRRMVDLIIPFRKKFLYHWKMKGSASIKNVLPVFVQNLSYKNLEIYDGLMASNEYLKFKKGNIGKDDLNKMFKNLESYCHLDTLAMYELYKILKNESKNDSN